jgi:ArsR family transcriptional regulator, virulence genes transcriptional regulator
MPSSDNTALDSADLIAQSELTELQKHARQAADMLKQLGNEHRLMILCSLINGELSVGELHKMTQLSQSALSQHLASLRNAQLVQTRREAQSIFYSLRGDDAVKIIRVLKSIYCP